MHDQIRVRVADRCEHVEYQLDATLDGKAVLHRKTVDAGAVDVFQYEVRLATGCYACIHQSRDSRMSEPRENRPLAFETRLTARAQQSEVQELDCDLSFEMPVTPVREPYCSHPALTELALESIRAELQAFEPGRNQVGQKSTPVGCAFHR